MSIGRNARRLSVRTVRGFSRTSTRPFPWFVRRSRIIVRRISLTELRNTISQMKTLYIERSTGASRDGNWVNDIDLDEVERIVVGTGPGSFAGIRSALAFTGLASAICKVLGFPVPVPSRLRQLNNRTTEHCVLPSSAMRVKARRGLRSSQAMRWSARSFRSISPSFPRQSPPTAA